MTCPSCSSAGVRRSSARGPERVSRLLLARKVYHCWSCGRRFSVTAFDPQEDTATSVLWSGIVLSLVFILLFVLYRLI